MRLIPLSNIVIPPDRQRQAFDAEALVELMSSIQTVGLLHPIIVRASEEGPVLVAGERRIRAIKDIFALGGSYKFEGDLMVNAIGLKDPMEYNIIPAIELGELTELEWSEAEFDENDKRENVTWQERASSTLRIQRLRILQSKARGIDLPTVADIALEVRGSSEGFFQEATRRELIVANHFSDPEVASAKSLDEAFKNLKKKEEIGKRAEHARVVGATFMAEMHRLHNADSCVWLPNAPDECYDVILTDPPYGMGADQFGDAGGGNIPHAYDDSANTLLAIINLALPHLYRVAKPQAHCYFFCDIDWFAEIRTRMEVAGWKVHRTPIIWHKPNAFLQPWPEHGPYRAHELILYAIKGNRPVNLRAADVITCSTEAGSTGPQKPVELIKELLKRSARPGDSVLDPFVGSGSIFPAAHALKVKATGVELDPATYVLAMRRLEKLKGDKA